MNAINTYPMFIPASNRLFDEAEQTMLKVVPAKCEAGFDSLLNELPKYGVRILNSTTSSEET